MPGTIWWDFDGTLASRPKLWSGAGLCLLAKIYPDHTVTQRDFAERLHSGLPWHRKDGAHPELATPDLWWHAIYDAYSRAFRHFGFNDNSLFAALPEIRSDILDAGRYTVFKDVWPALATLGRSGWCHVMVSNHVPELEEIVSDLGLRTFFRAVVTSGVIGYEKPHRRMFEAAREHSIADRPIWMIGDNPACDCLPMASLGVNAILVRSQSPQYLRCAPDLWSVLELINQGTVGP